MVDKSSKSGKQLPAALLPLAAMIIWVTWQWEKRDGKLTKPPYQGADRNEYAAVNEPSTWCSYAVAAASAEAAVEDGGVGIMLWQQSLGGLDLDHCRNPETGTLARWAQRILLRATNCYVEISPSGTGLRVAGFANGPVVDKRYAMPDGGRLEIYRGAKRFLTITGNQTHNKVQVLSNIDNLIDELVREGDQRKLEGDLSGGDGGTGDRTESGVFYKKVCELVERKGWSAEEITSYIEANPKLFQGCKVERYAARAGGLLQQVQAVCDKRELVHAEEDAQITEINRTHALVIIGDKTMVMRESDGPISFLQVGAFSQWFANQHIARGKRMVSLAHYWLEHHRRRQYQGIVFAPGDQHVPPSHFNLWRGFAVEPRAGDCSKFLAHIHDVVCCGSKRRYNWVMGWFAQIFQQPDNKLGTSLVLRGAEGTGKTIVGKIIGSLLGTHYCGPVSDSRWITGRFNAHLTACLLLHADEAFWAGDKAAEGRIKDLVTGTVQPIEFKGKEAIFIANYIRLFVTGNETWLVPAGMDARRFAVLDVAPDHANDTAYFAAIAAEMDNGGREALLHHLLNFDLTTVDLRKVPPTAGLLDQKLASLTPEQGWWLDVLHDGRLPNTAGAANRCLSQDLCEYYLKHATERGVRRRATETVLGRMLHKLAPGLRKGRSTGGGRIRSNIYTFPPLGECRAQFCELLQQHIAFDEPSEWQPGLVMGEATKQGYT